MGCVRSLSAASTCTTLGIIPAAESPDSPYFMAGEACPGGGRRPAIHELTSWGNQSRGWRACAGHDGGSAAYVNTFGRRYNLPPKAHYCGRPSPLRNRSVIGRDGTRDEVCDKYEAWLPTQLHLMARVRVLVGDDLVCWCAPKRCHCDFILRLANPHLFGVTT
jgi:hypothetical protein